MTTAAKDSVKGKSLRGKGGEKQVLEEERASARASLFSLCLCMCGVIGGLLMGDRMVLYIDSQEERERGIVNQ